MTRYAEILLRQQQTLVEMVARIAGIPTGDEDLDKVCAQVGRELGVAPDIILVALYATKTIQ